VNATYGDGRNSWTEMRKKGEEIHQWILSNRVRGRFVVNDVQAVAIVAL
jgi:hypothetical protein